MPTAERILALKLISDVGDINKQMRGVSGRYKKMADSAKSWGKAFATSFVLDGIEAVGNALGDAIGGYQSGQRAAAQLGNTWQNLGMDADALAGTLQKVTDSTLALGTSDDEAVAAFTQSIKRTKDYNVSLEHLQIAQDLVANGSAPNLAAAFKIIQQASNGSARVVDKFGLMATTSAGRVKELGKQVEGAGKKSAKLDPLKVTLNAISESTESFVGALSEGNLQGALDALAGIGTTLTDAIFTSGLADKFLESGRKLWNSMRTAITQIDWGKALTNVVYAIQTNADVLSAIAITGLALGAAFHGAMFVASIFAAAASAVFRAPAFLVSGVVGLAAKGAAKGLGAVFAGAMFLASTLVSWAWSAVTMVGHSAKMTAVAASVGRGLGRIMGRNLVVGAVIAVVTADVLGMVADAIRAEARKIFGFDLGPIGFPGLGSYATGTNSAARGWAMVGERGPELMHMGGGEKVIPNHQLGGMGGGNVTINIGIAGDPVATGREIDRVLRQFYRRSGQVTAR